MHTLQTALAVLWPYVPGILTLVLGAAYLRLTKWSASPAAATHPILQHLAGIAFRVANDAMAELRANAALTPTDALGWAVSELKAIAPDSIATLGADASDAALNALVRRSMLTVAQSTVFDGVARAVLAELRPGLTTVLAALPSPAAPAPVVPAANSVSGAYHGL